VQSKIGGGTEFITYFPLFQTSKLEETARGGASEVSFSSLSALGSVLVIDDEESVREVALALMQECGVRGFSAENGLEGIALFEKKREEVFAVLLDLTMPGISGEETYCEIRKIAPNLPVIFTSGYSEGSRIEKMLGGSPGGFLKKPFRLDELKEVLLRSLSAN
jgi:CheY-like chemotaxis protein